MPGMLQVCPIFPTVSHLHRHPDGALSARRVSVLWCKAVQDGKEILRLMPENDSGELRPQINTTGRRWRQAARISGDEAPTGPLLPFEQVLDLGEEGTGAAAFHELGP